MSKARLSGALLLTCLVAAAVWRCLQTGVSGQVIITLPPGPPFELAALVFEPRSHLRSARVDRAGHLMLETNGRALQVRIPEFCPVQVPRHTSSDVLQLEARALLDVGSDRAQLGYDTPFVIRVTPGCAEGERARITWRQLEGPPLGNLLAEQRGFSVTGRTGSLASFFAEPLPHGVVPVSPRTQGRYVLEAVAQIAGAEVLRRRVTLTASARATGLSSLAVSQRVMLGGEGWHVLRGARGAQAQVELRAGVATFAPDARGQYLLADAQGRQLTLQALPHDETPLDCGRAECHAGESRAALDSPMSHALEHLFAGQVLPAASCALDCHATGEPGLNDGGFRAVAAALQFRPLTATSWQELPHALQRLAGVRCTSCHGPGAIPAHEGRSRILRADVCATCHDSPPRYTHVADWRASRMARADATPAQREPACAGCHTTGGFLAAIGARVRPDLSRDPDDAVVGIACAACHAPHAAHLERALVRASPAPRSLPVSPSLAGSPSALCANCHAPRPDERVPSAASAALWLGAVRLPEVLGGGELRGPAPHGALPGGCLACHGKHTAPEARGTHHSFAVDANVCVDCHAQPPSPAADALGMRARVLQVLSALRRRCGASAAVPSDGVSHHSTPPVCRTELLGRGLYAASLLAEDGAAFVHNAAFARQLLEQAEAALATGEKIHE